MDCPRCEGKTLETTKVGIHDVQVDTCDGCGGLWLDRGELEQLSDGPEKLARAQWSERRDRERTRCPRCLGSESYRSSDKTMIALAPEDDAELILDRCSECFGFWLDGGELQRLRERQFKKPPEPDEAKTLSFAEWFSMLFRVRD